MSRNNPVGFFWSRETGIRKIPPVGTDANNLAWGMNNRGQVVGDSCTDNTFRNCRAFVYEKGVATDLNTLLPPSASLQLVLANDINDAGEIVGFGIDEQGKVVAFLAVPVADGDRWDRREPSAVVLPDAVRRRIPLIGRSLGHTGVR
jgi:probable HAF family extracellular repeat protein